MSRPAFETPCYGVTDIPDIREWNRMRASLEVMVEGTTTILTSHRKLSAADATELVS